MSMKIIDAIPSNAMKGRRRSASLLWLRQCCHLKRLVKLTAAKPHPLNVCKIITTLRDYVPTTWMKKPTHN